MALVVPKIPTMPRNMNVLPVNLIKYSGLDGYQLEGVAMQLHILNDIHAPNDDICDLAGVRFFGTTPWTDLKYEPQH